MTMFPDGRGMWLWEPCFVYCNCLSFKGLSLQQLSEHRNHWYDRRCHCDWRRVSASKESLCRSSMGRVHRYWYGERPGNWIGMCRAADLKLQTCTEFLRRRECIGGASHRGHSGTDQCVDQLMSNNATAAMLCPICIPMAMALGISGRG